MGIASTYAHTQENELLTARNVAKLFKCSVPLIYKMAERGQLACVRWSCPGEGTEKPRSTVRFKLSDVLGFIEKHYTTT